MASLFRKRTGSVNPHIYVLSAVFLLGFNTSAVLSSSAGRGREFIFTFPTNFQRTTTAGETVLTLSLTAFHPGPTVINITVVNLGWSRVLTILNQHDGVTVDLPPEAEARRSAMQNTTILVTASKDVTVFALSSKEESTGGFLVRSTQNLGTEYFVASYVPIVGEWSEFTISATADDTLVRIYLRAPLIFDDLPYNRGEINISLARLQTAQFQSVRDLTGSRISANRPISVISGSSTSNVPVEIGPAQHVVDHLPPVSAWGKEYAVAPFLGRRSGYRCKVVAGCPITMIRGFGERVALFTAGDSHEWDALTDAPAVITASKPVLVVQYSKGRQAEGGDKEVGNSAMFVIPPINGYVAGVALLSTPVLPEGAYRHITVTTRCNETSGIKLNDSPLVPDLEFGYNENEIMCTVQKMFQPTDLSHVTRVEHSSPGVPFAVSVAVYGTSFMGAYATSANLGTDSQFCETGGTDECCNAGDMISSVYSSSSINEVSESIDYSSLDPIEAASAESHIFLNPDAFVASNTAEDNSTMNQLYPQDPTILSNTELYATVESGTEAELYNAESGTEAIDSNINNTTSEIITQDIATEIETITQRYLTSTPPNTEYNSMVSDSEMTASTVRESTKSTGQAVFTTSASPSSSADLLTNSIGPSTLIPPEHSVSSAPTIAETSTLAVHETSAMSTDRQSTERTKYTASTKLSTDHAHFTWLASTMSMTSSREQTTEMENQSPCTLCETPAQILLYGGVSMVTLLLLIVLICLVKIIHKRRKARIRLQKKTSRWVAFPVTMSADELSLSRTNINDITKGPVTTE